MRPRTVGAAVAAALLAAGCAEYDQTTEADYEQQQQPASAGAAGAGEAAPRARGPGDMPRPSTGAARRAAHGTVDRINEHQREIEKALEND